jgi:hypothetical protein
VWDNPLPVEDSYIAATARRHNLTIVTGNDKHFRRPGLKVFNPFKELANVESRSRRSEFDAYAPGAGRCSVTSLQQLEITAKGSERPTTPSSWSISSAFTLPRMRQSHGYAIFGTYDLGQLRGLAWNGRFMVASTARPVGCGGGRF